jgi:hypothetical protein
MKLMPAKMASNTAKILWESGIWLSEAWEAFAPAELLAQFEESQGFYKAFTGGPVPKDLAGIGQKASDAIFKMQKRQQLEKEMKEAVLIKLFNNDLIATGYREFPSSGRYPITIDADKFEFDDPIWANQSLRFDLWKD